MNTDKVNAILASAWNVMGPRSGTPATPATIDTFPAAEVLSCVVRYRDEHDGSLFTHLEIGKAACVFAARHGIAA